MSKIFEFDDYKEILRYKIAGFGQVRGYQSKLADAAGCQKAYLSQVLHTHIQLTPDHAANIAVYWQLTEDETQYFLDLVSLERAATPQLRKILGRRISAIRKKNETLSSQISSPAVAVTPTALRYYGAWHYAAIHILTTIPAMQTPRAIAGRLLLPLPLVHRTLKDLCEFGLCEQSKGRFLATKNDVHMPQNSPVSSMNHFNWRQRAIARMQESSEEGTHYTAIHGLSNQAVKEIKALLRDVIVASRAVVAPSKEEDIACLTIDFFRL